MIAAQGLFVTVRLFFFFAELFNFEQSHPGVAAVLCLVQKQTKPLDSSPPRKAAARLGRARVSVGHVNVGRSTRPFFAARESEGLFRGIFGGGPGPGLIGAEMRGELAVALQFKSSHHFVEGCAGRRTGTEELPGAFGATKAPKMLLFNPNQLSIHGVPCWRGQPAFTAGLARDCRLRTRRFAFARHRSWIGCPFQERCTDFRAGNSRLLPPKPASTIARTRSYG